MAKKTKLEQIRFLNNVWSEKPYQLSKEQLKRVKIAQNQLSEGKIKSHNAAKKEIEKWLAK